VNPPHDPLPPFEEVPANRHLGFHLVSQSEGEAVVKMEVRPEFMQEIGLLHGGFLSAVADTAAVYALLPGLGRGRRVTSIEFKVNFLRPVLLDRGAVSARARVVRQGRKISVVEVELEQKQALVAKGLFTYLLLENAQE
jgi:acyl-CoA thioesterase